MPSGLAACGACREAGTARASHARQVARSLRQPDGNRDPSLPASAEVLAPKGADAVDLRAMPAQPAERPTGTATILFTDLVESTAQRARLGEETAEKLWAAHDRLL